VRVSKGGQHHDCVPPFETHRYAMLLRVRFGPVHCGARDGDGARWHVELFAGTLSVVDANRFRHPAQFSGCTLEANRLSPLATTRPRRSDQRVDQGLFAFRRGPEKAGHAGKDTTACIAVGDASIAVTSSHVSLIEHAGPPRATPMT
jgi:hypothetical protein